MATEIQLNRDIYNEMGIGLLVGFFAGVPATILVMGILLGLDCGVKSLSCLACWPGGVIIGVAAPLIAGLVRKSLDEKKGPTDEIHQL
jgi:hypothetical protein